MKVFYGPLICFLLIASSYSHSRHEPMFGFLDFVSNPDLIFEAGIPPCPVYGINGEVVQTQKCRPSGFSCQFYNQCISKLVDCEGEEKNYFKNYGLKYCEVFKNDLFMDRGISDATRLWIRCTMKCLQKTLLDTYRKSDYKNQLSAESKSQKCKRYHKTAFDSHPDCYTNNGLCFLMPPTQQAKIALSVDASDLFTEESKKQVKDALGNCANDLLDYADGGDNLSEKVKLVLQLQSEELDLTLCETKHLNSKKRDPCYNERNKVTDYLDICI